VPALKLVRILIAVVALAAAGCSMVTTREAPPATESRPQPAPAAGKGAYYKDDGPGANPPPDLAAIPDAVPRPEPLNRFANRPYQVFGKDYVPATRVAPFKQTGIASWYGRRYHGAATSSGERYDMYAMTAAHPTLPIPSYARVTNLGNGRSVVVRVNDRGPFLADRIIDLSYVAAWKLGYVEAGSARVEVASVLPGSAAAVAAPEAASNAEPKAAPEAAPEAATNAATKAGTKGVYLQLGAFATREAAESFRVRIYRDLPWLSQAIRVIDGGAAFRLHLGPYPSPDEARPIAERIQAELKFAPLLIER